MKTATITIDSGANRNISGSCYIWQGSEIFSSIRFLYDYDVIVAATGYLAVKAMTKFVLSLDPEIEITFQITAEARNMLEKTLVKDGARNMDNAFTSALTTS